MKKHNEKASRPGAVWVFLSLFHLLFVLVLSGCRPGSEKWDKWKMERAQRFEKSGSLLRAAEECEEVARYSHNLSTVASALFLRGDCLIRAARYVEAEGAFQEILERFKDGDPVYSQMARYRLVECYKAAGRLPEAAAALRLLLEKLDKKVERALALKDLGEVLALEGDPGAGKVLAEAAAGFNSVANDKAMDPEFRAYARDLAAQTEELAGRKPQGSASATLPAPRRPAPEPLPRRLSQN